MKRLAGLLIPIFLVTTGCGKNDDFPVLKGPYLGQKPPGMTPEIFAPGIISLEGSYEGGATFSYDGRYFCYKKKFQANPKVEKIWICEYKDGKFFFFKSNRSAYKSYSETPLTYEEKIRILNSPGNSQADIYWWMPKLLKN